MNDGALENMKGSPVRDPVANARVHFQHLKGCVGLVTWAHPTLIELDMHQGFRVRLKYLVLHWNFQCSLRSSSHMRWSHKRPGTYLTYYCGTVKRMKNKVSLTGRSHHCLCIACIALHPADEKEWFDLNFWHQIFNWCTEMARYRKGAWCTRSRESEQEESRIVVAAEEKKNLSKN